MDSTPFSNRVRLLADFYMEYSGTDEWSDFFAIQDLGIPAAVLLENGAVDLTDTGILFVNESWNALCDALDIDRDGSYEDIEEMTNETAG